MDGFLADGQCTGWLLLTVAPKEIIRLGQIDLRTDGAVAVAGNQFVQGSEIGRVFRLIVAAIRIAAFQLI